MKNTLCETCIANMNISHNMFLGYVCNHKIYPSKRFVIFAIARVNYTNCIANTFVNNNTLQQLYLYHTKPNKRITCLQRCKCMHNYNNINKQVVYINVLKLG